jgi:beta-galactosidase
VLMRYGASNGWLDGQPAVLMRQVGRGSITYVGAWLDDPLMSKLTASWSQMSQIQPIIPNVPEGVEVCQRSGRGKTVVIVINHSTSSQSIALPSAMKDLLSNDAALASQLTLPAHGLAVLE